MKEVSNPMFKGIIDKVPSMDEIKTMLTGVGATAADFASKISDMLPSVDDLMSFLPNKDDILGFIDNITPSFLKDPTAAEKVLKLIPKDKFLSYTWKKMKSKYRGSKEKKGLESLFDTYVDGDRTLEKLYKG